MKCRKAPCSRHECGKKNAAVSSLCLVFKSESARIWQSKKIFQGANLVFVLFPAPLVAELLNLLKVFITRKRNAPSYKEYNCKVLFYSSEFVMTSFHCKARLINLSKKRKYSQMSMNYFNLKFQLTILLCLGKMKNTNKWIEHLMKNLPWKWNVVLHV